MSAEDLFARMERPIEIDFSNNLNRSKEVEELLELVNKAEIGASLADLALSMQQKSSLMKFEVALFDSLLVVRSVVWC